MPSPLLDQHLCLLQRVEDLVIEKLVPELCSEMPRRRHTSPVLCPCESKTSASRRIATRYDKTAQAFLSMICIACMMVWLR